MPLELLQAGVIAVLCSLGSGFALTSLLMPMAIRLGHRFHIIDTPGARRIHTTPTPRTGGLALFFGMLLGTTLLLNITGALPWRVEHQAASLLGLWPIILLGCAIAAIVGLVDDIYQLRPLYKLAGQFLAAVAVSFLGLRIRYLFGIELPPGIDFIATVFWYLFITNTYNLIDGLDGLAAGLGAIAALGLMGTLASRGLYAEALVVITFIGALLAFLRYNWYPAKVFLGDAGSNFVGFFLAVMALHSGSKASTFMYAAVPLMALSIPMFDAALAIWRRSTRMTLRLLLNGQVGSGIFSGDVEHLHHRLLKLGLSQRDVTAILYLANAMLVLAGLVVLQLPQAAEVILTTVFIASAFLLIRYVPLVEAWDSALALIHGLARPVRPLLALTVYSTLDFASLILSLFAAVQLSNERFFTGWLSTFRGWCVYPLVLLLFGEVVCRFTKRRRSRRFLVLTLCLALGTAISIARTHHFHPQFSPEFLAIQGSLFFFCSALCTIGIRFLPEAVEQLLAQHAHHLAIQNQESCAIAVIPLGMDETQIADSLAIPERSIIARRIHEIPEILLHNAIREIRLLLELTADEEDELSVIAKRYGITVIRASEVRSVPTFPVPS